MRSASTRAGARIRRRRSVATACNCLSRRFVHWTSSLSSRLADSFHHYQAHNLTHHYTTCCISPPPCLTITSTTVTNTTTIIITKRAVVRPQQRDAHSNVIEITISLGDGTRDGGDAERDGERCSSEDSTESVESPWNFEREDVPAGNTRCSWDNYLRSSHNYILFFFFNRILHSSQVAGGTRGNSTL